MLSNTLFRVPRRSGLQLLHRRDDNGAGRELTSWRVCLQAGDNTRYERPDEETVIVLQEGRGTFATPDTTWAVERAGVFQERATALFLPPGVPLTIAAESTLEAILVSAPARS